jgi:hypothetical protein
MSAEINAIAAIIGALTVALVKKGTLTRAEAQSIFEEGKTALGSEPGQSYKFQGLQLINRLMAKLPAAGT